MSRAGTYAQLAAAGTYLCTAQLYATFAAWAWARGAARRSGSRDYFDREGRRYRWIQSVPEVGAGAAALIVISQRGQDDDKRNAARVADMVAAARRLGLTVQGEAMDGDLGYSRGGRPR